MVEFVLRMRYNKGAEKDGKRTIREYAKESIPDTFLGCLGGFRVGGTKEGGGPMGQVTPARSF